MKTAQIINDKKQKKVHLSTKLLVLIVAILVISIVTLAIISVNSSSVALLKQADTENQEYAIEGANHVASIIEGNLKALDEVATKPAVMTMDFNTQAVAMAEDVKLLGYQDIAVMNLQGHAKYVLDKGEFDSAGQFWYENGFKGISNISDVSVSKVTNAPVVFDVAPIKKDGQVLGTLVGRRDPTFLSNTTNAMGDGVRKYGFVIGSDGSVMSHPDNQMVLEQKNVMEDIESGGLFKGVGLTLKNLGTGNAGMIKYEEENISYIGAVAPIPSTAWSLVVTQFEEDILAPVTNLRNLILIISLIILILSGIATYFIARQMTKPIDKLIKSVSAVLKELAVGNLNSSMEGEFSPEHTKIKEDMNKTVKFLNRCVEEIKQTLESVSEGDLTQEITSYYKGDFLPIKMAINGIVTDLRKVMSEIDDAVDQVEIGAKQISDGGQGLSQGTTQQAAAIQELTASIEEVDRETKGNALNANEANELAVIVRTNAEVGNEQMAEMVTAMAGIDDSSKNISKIIKVIDDIAFQTNILSLNAAVEAARAGQHGKGFAVVAEEVRNLAAKSAEAAKETTKLIKGSMNKVEIGSKIASETEISLKEILKEIEKVTALVGNIAHASNDQAMKIAEITQGIEQVSQVVQTNSATAEETAASSEELFRQAEMLKKKVEVFKIS